MKRRVDEILSLKKTVQRTEEGLLERIRQSAALHELNESTTKMAQLIEDLWAENQALKSHNETRVACYDACLARCELLENKLLAKCVMERKYREALEYYADPSMWPSQSDFNGNGWETARQALSGE